MGKGSKFVFTLPKWGPEEILKEYIANSIKEVAERNSTRSLVVVGLAKYEQIRKHTGEEKTTDLLKGIELVIQEALRRESDNAIRLAGEIIVFLPDVKKENTAVIKMRIQNAIERYQLDREEKWIKESQFYYTLVNYSEDADSPEELIRQIRKTGN